MFKRKLIVLDFGRNSRAIKEKLVSGRTFSLLSISSMLFFITLGITSMIYQQSSASTMQSMKGLAASVSSGVFGDILEMEVPAFQSNIESDAFTGKQMSMFLMRALTDINPSDPKSLLAGELPGMRINDSFLIRSGVGTDTAVGPQDHAPIALDPMEGLEEDEGTEVILGEDDESIEPNQQPGPSEAPVSGGTKGNTVKEPAIGLPQVAFIYHSHNRESWYPELDGKSKDANSTTKNITLVGKRLADKLEENGIGAMHSNTDYPTEITDYRWAYSYKYSKKTVKEALASSNDLKFIFDIHRDSQKRKYTTVDIDGKSYAQVYFIIGHKNPNWKKNEEFATKIHEEMEKNYPGISRGIWGKSSATGNGEYNQSLASDSVLIEIGGVENTIEESYRTADVLAEAVAAIYWKAEKVSGKE